MGNEVFGKTMENVRGYRNIKLVATEKKKNYLVSETNCHTTKLFTKNLLAIKMKKTQTFFNNPVYLRLSVLNLNKTVMYEFCYVYLKPKYGENAKLYYMNTGSFIVNVKTEDMHKDLAEKLEKIKR